MSWVHDFKLDIDRYRRRDAVPTLRVVASQQGLWALLQYRVARATYVSDLPDPVKKPLLAGMSVWHKAIEVTTGISLPKEASIGPGLTIAHIGNVVVNPGASLGRGCTIQQGVTIGLSWGKGRHGVPVIGDNVYIGTNAVVAGRITVGDHAAISANSLVLRDVPARGFARGVPAQVREPGDPADAESDLARDAGEPVAPPRGADGEDAA